MTRGSGRRGELDINELIMCSAIFLSEVFGSFLTFCNMKFMFHCLWPQRTQKNVGCDLDLSVIIGINSVYNRLQVV